MNAHWRIKTGILGLATKADAASEANRAVTSAMGYVTDLPVGFDKRMALQWFLSTDCALLRELLSSGHLDASVEHGLG